MSAYYAPVYTTVLFSLWSTFGPTNGATKFTAFKSTIKVSHSTTYGSSLHAAIYAANFKALRATDRTAVKGTHGPTQLTTNRTALYGSNKAAICTAHATTVISTIYTTHSISFRATHWTA